MIKVAVVGLGKMGISHLGIINAHPAVEVVAVCDATKYMLDVLEKYSGIPGYTDYDKLLAEASLDAVVIATPSRLHAPMVEKALARGLHVFCEKPFTLDPEDSRRLAATAAERNLVNQVGYHYRFVGTFLETKRLLDLGAIGEVTAVMAEAYGPVVLKPKGSTWRTQSAQGGGCLYDYAAHPLNLLNWYFGAPDAVAGSVLKKVFSRDTDDEVYSTLLYPGDMTGQLSVSWSDESYRKMGTKITVRGTKGKITADRQELQVFLRDTATVPAGYQEGWTLRYVTDLTEEVWFYIRGEEYSAQIDYFAKSIADRALPGRNTFADAAQTDDTIAMIKTDAEGGDPTRPRAVSPQKRAGSRFNIFNR
jgi:predicted dehydrogenase